MRDDPMRTQLSSEFTFVLKYIFFPLWCVAAFGMVVAVFVASKKFEPTLVALGSVLFIVFLGWLRVRKIFQVSYDDKYVYLKNYTYEKIIELDKVRTTNGANLFSFNSSFEIELYPYRGTIEKFEFIPPFSEHLEYTLNGRLSGRVLQFRRFIGGDRQ